MNYLLDTNIILIYARASELADKLEAKYQLFSGFHTLAVSVVTLGEIESIAHQLNYGEKKKNRINDILNDLLQLDIRYEDIIQRYAEIDAFSQGKHKTKTSNFTARNMGKNDLWIAATANVFNAILFNTDKDFLHLHQEFLQLEYIDLKNL